MRLLEAIIDANHRAVAGDQNAGLHPADYADGLPLIALTCIDARLNRLLPSVLGVPDDQFIWLRSAGNIITDPVGAMMRSLSRPASRGSSPKNAAASLCKVASGPGSSRSGNLFIFRPWWISSAA